MRINIMQFLKVSRRDTVRKMKLNAGVLHFFPVSARAGEPLSFDPRCASFFAAASTCRASRNRFPVLFAETARCMRCDVLRQAACLAALPSLPLALWTPLAASFGVFQTQLKVSKKVAKSANLRFNTRHTTWPHRRGRPPESSRQ